MTGGQAVEPCGPSDGDHATDETGWHPDYRGQISDSEMAAIESVTLTGEWL